MKWKGGRQSKNVEDKTNDPLPDIPDGTIMFGTGEIYHKEEDPYQNPKKEQRYSKDDVKVAKELGRLNREGKNPIPTPNPKIIRTQVTPGKWITK